MPVRLSNIILQSSKDQAAFFNPSAHAEGESYAYIDPKRSEYSEGAAVLQSSNPVFSMLPCPQTDPFVQMIGKLNRLYDCPSIFKNE